MPSTLVRAARVSRTWPNLTSSWSLRMVRSRRTGWPIGNASPGFLRSTWRRGSSTRAVLSPVILQAAMKTIDAMTSERLDSLADDFKKAMRAAERIFGNDAFRKRSRQDDARNPVSMPLFEVWSVQLARCSPEQIDRLVARREEVRNRFMTLVNENSEFYNAISYSTGMPQRIQRRFAAIQDLVQELF